MAISHHKKAIRYFRKSKILEPEDGPNGPRYTGAVNIWLIVMYVLCQTAIDAACTGSPVHH